MIAPIEGFCNTHIEATGEPWKIAVKMRLDRLLVMRGLAETRSKAQDLIRRGAVRLGSRIVLKTGFEVSAGEPIEVIENTHYVARSAWKLLAALDHFGFSPADRTCLDVGASTGGFTQVLLERGAARVFAVDVGHDQLHSSLKMNPKVISMEKTDARALTPDRFDAQIGAVTCDVSFISLLKILPPILQLAHESAWLVALVKPQFEAGRALIGKGGIVKDEQARAAAVNSAIASLEAAGWTVRGALPSPLAGQDGNEETLVGATRHT
jgi:23S rRNA (cytidine1920-2'-O)/16S rRNA (cytidine1409-2'-O)-methyltransferase